MMREGWELRVDVLDKERYSRSYGEYVTAYAGQENGVAGWEVYVGNDIAADDGGLTRDLSLEDAMLAAEQWVASQTWPVGAPDAAAAQAHREAVEQATSDKLDEAIERVHGMVLMVMQRSRTMSQYAIERLRDLDLGAVPS